MGQRAKKTNYSFNHQEGTPGRDSWFPHHHSSPRVPYPPMPVARISSKGGGTRFFLLLVFWPYFFGSSPALAPPFPWQRDRTPPSTAIVYGFLVQGQGRGDKIPRNLNFGLKCTNSIHRTRFLTRPLAEVYFILSFSVDLLFYPHPLRFSGQPL